MDFNKGNLDPKYVAIMNFVDSISLDLTEDSRYRLYNDLEDTFHIRKNQLKPKKKFKLFKFRF